MLAERRVASEARRQRLIYEQMPGFVGVLCGPMHVYEYVNRAYQEISGRREMITKPFVLDTLALRIKELI